VGKKPSRTIEEIRAAIAARLATVRSWGLSLNDLEAMIAENPHVYAPISGFLAEYKCRQLHLTTNAKISQVVRPSGYDKAQKGDFSFLYKNEPIRLEIKSLDGPHVRHLEADRWTGTFQCNASDARTVTLPNCHKVHTNCIVSGGWDILAVNLYTFGNHWRFAFARQRDLPRASTMYKEEDRPYLLASSMSISLPLTAPYTSNLVALLDEIVRERGK